MLYTLISFCSAEAGAQTIYTIAGNGTWGFSGDGGPATAATFAGAFGVACDTSGNVFVADYSNYRVRKIDVHGIITTIAGNGTRGIGGNGGPATAANLHNPCGIAADNYGNVFLADYDAGFRKIDPSGTINMFAGGGSATAEGIPAATSLSMEEFGIGVDATGNVYVAIQIANGSVRKVNTAGLIYTIAGPLGVFGSSGFSGDGGPATAARFTAPETVECAPSGDIFIGDYQNYRVRVVNSLGIVNTYAGNGSSGFSGDGGPATAAAIGRPTGLACDNFGNVYIIDLTASRVRKITPSGIITTVAGTGTAGYSGDGGPATAAQISAGGIAVDRYNNVYIAGGNRIRIFNDHNRPPRFVGGHSQSITVCGTTADSLNSTLAILDSDNFQQEVWHLLTPPLHGSAVITDTELLQSHPFLPTGQYYVAASGYTGNDSFIVSVTDGFASDTMTVYVTVNAVPAPISGPSYVCVGNSITMTDISSGGVWTVNNVNASIGSSTGVVTGTSAGIDTVRFTTTNGCYAAREITVNSLPGAITGPATVCIGSYATMLDTPSGGTWTTTTGSIISIGSAAGIVAGLTAGVGAITYTLPTGCTRASSITVNPLPAAITGITGVCTGGSTTLSDASPGGIWSSGASSYASVGLTSGLVHGLTPGSSLVSYTLPTGCTVSTTVTVNVNPPTIAGVLYLCPGTMTVLSDPITGGTWSAPGYTGVVSVGSISGSVTGISAGTATITYVSPAGCIYTDGITVNPLPAAVTGASNICPGQTLNLADGTPGGTWTSGATGTATVNGTTGLVTGVATGTASMTYTLPTGCKTSATITVNVSPVAITGSPVLCLGYDDTLSDATGGGTWTNANTSVAFIDAYTGIMTGFATSSDVVTYTLGNGCYATMGVAINTAPGAIAGAGSVCAGANANLFNSVSGGIWSSGNTSVATIGSSSGVYTGVSPGTATINYSTGSGCTVSTTVTVLAAPATITGTLNICPGGSTTLSSASSGGTWSSTSPKITIGSASGTVTGISAGTAVVTYTTGCFTTATVTVNSTPIITGTLNLCPNSSTALTTGLSGTWTSGSASIATVGSTGTLTGVTSGTVTVVCTSSTTGCSASVVATVNPAPGAISGMGTVCTGSAISLSSSPSGGTWSRSNSNINVSSSGLTAGMNAGTANVTYTIPATGCYAIKPVTVYTTPAGITGGSSVCVGASLNLSDLTPGGTWTSSNTAVATIGSTGVLNALTAGTSVISYSLGSGCAATATLTVSPLPALFLISGGGGICAGGSGLHIGLSGSATGTTYTLYRGGTTTGTTLAGTGSSIDFGPQTVGNYTIIANNGCSSSMTGSVTVSINPTPVISGPTAVCAGATATLSAVPGGTWSSSNPGIVTIGSSSGVVAGVAIGSAAITCFPIGGCIAVTTMNVTSAPSAITGASTVCTGATTILTSTPSGGVWTSSNVSIASVGSMNGTVTGIAPGSAIITYSLGGGCNTMATVNVVPSPAAITGTINVCSGGSTVLTTTTGGGSWSSGATGIATVSASGIVTGGTAGTATISYTVSGCSSTVIVTVNAVPPLIGGPASLCQGTTAAETNTLSGGVWTTSSAGIGITGAGTTATITGTSSGVGTITYNVSGCSTVKTITVNTAPTITGTRTLCTGNSTTLTTGVSGTWSSGASGIATITASGLVNAISAGTAPITFTPPTGCIATTTITVNSTPPPITGPLDVCTGSTTAYTAAGGSWVSSSASVATIGSATGILTAVSPGVVTITCPPTGCSSSLTITVNALPAAITGSSSSVCVGASVSLASTTPGGTWGSSNTSFATVGSSTGIVSGINAGSANISYTVSGCSVTKTMTVTATPSISGPNKVCLGSTITLTPGTTGGIWSSSNPVVASVGSASGVVNGASLGNATISYSLGPGCTMTTGMTVDPLPAAISGGSNICVGRTTTLSDATPGGAWSSGTAFASVNSATGVVTGIAGGAAIISYIGPNGCASTATINVIQLQPITGIRALCAWGDTMRVANADTTGTYTSTFATVLNIGHGGGIVTARVPGISSVTYTIPLGCSITAQVTVNPLPAGISGVLNICPGGTTTLSDVSPAGTWSSVTPAVAGIGAASGIATASSAGTTRIIYTLPTGCKTDTLLTVTAPPVAGTITGRNNLCVGSTTLLAGGVGGAWNSGVPSVATISTTGVVTGIATGTATIAYSISNLCGTDAAQATVNVYPAVTAGTITGLDTICAGNSTILTDTATGGAWAGTNTSIASVGSMGEVLGLLAGTDTITYRVANPGCSAMAMHTVEVLPHAICGLSTSTQLITSQQLQLWPNPNDGTFTVRLISPFNEEVQISISDVAGRIITGQTTTTNTDLGITTLRPGIYLLHAQNAHGNFISKVIVQ